MAFNESENGGANHQVAQMGERTGVEAEAGQREQQAMGERYHEEMRRARPEGGANVGANERAVSLASGAILGLLGLSRRSLPGLVTAGVGAMLAYRGATGYCGMYEKLGISTNDPEDAYANGIQISTAVTINKPAEELYRFWRNFENLTRFMEHVESVRVLDERRSHWIVKTAAALGGTTEWDAEITEDKPNEVIAWRSLEGSPVQTAGQVRFVKALGDRGTEVHVWMNYTPPGGTLGHWVASLLGANPKRVVHEELKTLQRIMEIGEPLKLDGQPHGSCMGRGKRQQESSWKPLFM